MHTHTHYHYTTPHICVHIHTLVQVHAHTYSGMHTHTQPKWQPFMASNVLFALEPESHCRGGVHESFEILTRFQSP